MINLLELLENIVNELPMSEFKKACEKAGINESLQETILEIIAVRGE